MAELPGLSCKPGGEEAKVAESVLCFRLSSADDAGQPRGCARGALRFQPQHPFDLHDVPLRGCPDCVGPFNEDADDAVDAKALTLALVETCLAELPGQHIEL